MLDNPEPFKKAQIELDQVVGPSRLPNCDDRYGNTGCGVFKEGVQN